MSDSEQWRPVPGYEAQYDVSDHGRVRSLPRPGARGGILGGRFRPADGYVVLKLRRDGKSRHTYVHAVVALAFLGPRLQGQEVRHLNGDPTDNRLSNLAYGTRSENCLDRVRHRTHQNTKKTHCPSGHPYDEANTRVIPSRPTARYCRACCDSRSKAAA